MIRRTLSLAERTLRGEPVRLTHGLLVGWAGGCVYGAVMGAFGERPLQMLYSAVKVPLLLAATTVLSLPSYFVLNTLLGLRADFATAVKAVIGTQAAVGLILAALAPYPALWYATTGDYHEATLFNGLMFLVASASAQWVLRRRYAPLVARNRRHRIMLWVWVVVYAFVGIQMGWMLRPFIGDPARPTTFFRPDTWGNAYVIVFDLIRDEVTKLGR
jgi:hypothetical protein